jgi:protein phosphatase
MAERFFAIIDPGRKRPTNQDQAAAVELRDGRVLLVVADGVGGVPGGEIASAAALKAVQRVLAHHDFADPRAALAHAVLEANRMVRVAALEDERLALMATTLVVVTVDGPDAWVANAGDSRAYRFRAGALERLTEDDSWVAEEVRAGRLTEEAAAQHPRRNVITRAVGSEAHLAVDVFHHPVLPGDTLFLCTDGLYQALPEAVIASVLAFGAPARDTAVRLVELANEAGGPDNIGIALLQA